MHHQLPVVKTIFTALLILKASSSLQGQQPELLIPRGHSYNIEWAFVHPSGEKAFSVSRNEIIFWDVTANRPLVTLTFQSVIRQAQLSDKGDFLAVSFFTDSSQPFLLLYDTKTARVIQQFTLNESSFNPRFLSISPDGQYLLTLGDVGTGKYLAVVAGLDGKVHYTKSRQSPFISDKALFSSDSKYLIINESTHIAYIAISNGNVDKTVQIKKMAKHPIHAFDRSPINESLVMVNNKGTFILDQGSTEARMLSKQNIGVRFSTNGLYLISDLDEVYDIETGQLAGNISDGADFSRKVNPFRGKLYAQAAEKEVRLCDSKTGKVSSTLKGSTDQVISIGTASDGNKLLFGSAKSFLKVLDLETGRYSEIKHVAVSGLADLQNNTLGFTSPIGFYLYDFNTSSVTKSVTIPFNGGQKTLSPGGTYVVESGGEILSPEYRILKSEDATRLYSFPSAASAVNYILFSSKDTYFATFTTKEIVVYEAATKKQLWKHSEENYISYAKSSFTPNEKTLLVNTAGNRWKIFDVQTGQIRDQFDFSDGGTFLFSLVGSDGKCVSSDGKQITLFDYQGRRKLWSLETPNFTFDFKVIEQRSLLVACCRNYENLFIDLNTGKILYSIVFLGYNDWLVSTPDGLYEGSQNAVNYLLYRVGDEVIPASSLYEKHYSPGLFFGLLHGKTISREKSEKILPLPLVRILSPQMGLSVDEQNVKVMVNAQDQGGGIDEVRLYHNGKLIDGTTRGFKSTGQNHEFTVTLTDGENRIKATAFNTQRTESIPDEIVVNYKAPEVVKPNMHILAVGINNYLNPKYNLNYAKNDADAFVQSLSTGASSLFGKVEVTTINDANATKTGILAAIEKIKTSAKAEDVFVLYYAGHGVMSTGNGVEKPQFYLVPHDVTKMYEADEMLKKSGISATEIGEFSKTIKAQKQLFVIDACQSGGAMQTLAMRGAAEEKAIAQLARSTGTYFIAASGTEQFATEVAELGHGIFTYSVIEALKGSCKSQDGKVTVNLLKSCVEDMVPELSKKHKGQPQFPTGYGFGMDFPVVMVK